MLFGSYASHDWLAINRNIMANNIGDAEGCGFPGAVCLTAEINARLSVQYAISFLNARMN